MTNYSYCSGLEIVKRQDEFCVYFRVYVMPLLLISGCITGNHRNKPDHLEYYYTIFHTLNGKENGVISWLPYNIFLTCIKKQQTNKQDNVKH